MKDRETSPVEQIRAWRVVIDAVGLGLFLGSAIAAVYVFGDVLAGFVR